jgi:hypothetical protein
MMLDPWFMWFRSQQFTARRLSANRSGLDLWHTCHTLAGRGTRDDLRELLFPVQLSGFYPLDGLNLLGPDGVDITINHHGIHDDILRRLLHGV